MRPNRDHLNHERLSRVSTATLLCVSSIAGAYLAVFAGRRGFTAGAWLALFPLFAAVRVCRPAEASAVGALWGAAMFAFTAYVGPAHERVPLTVVSLLFLGGAPAIYAGTATWLTRRIGFSPFVLGVAWIGAELTLAWRGLRPGFLASDGLDVAVLEHIAQGWGYVFVAFLVAYANATLVAALGAVCQCDPRPIPAAGADSVRRVIEAQCVRAFRAFAMAPSRPRGPPAFAMSLR